MILDIYRRLILQKYNLIISLMQFLFKKFELLYVLLNWVGIGLCDIKVKEYVQNIAFYDKLKNKFISYSRSVL